MIASVRFAPLALASSLPCTRSTVVVSILSSFQQKSRPPFRGCGDVLNLTFVDLSEDMLGLRPGTWPNEPTAEEHEVFSELPAERLPALSDALAAVRFLRKHHSTAEPVDVLVHCFAGASRSAAVARWTARRFNVPLVDLAGQGTSDANRRVLRLLRLADRRKIV